MYRAIGWPRSRYFAEIALAIAGYLFYIGIKQLIAQDLEVIAFENARKIIDLELSLNLFWEREIQQWLLYDLPQVVIFFNWVYTLAFFPVLIPAAIVLFIFRYRTFVFYRNIFLISYVFTWLIYLTFPVAPPRMMVEHGYVDTIETMGPAIYNAKETLSYYNQFSAMPSMHFGWTLLFGIIFIKSKHPLLRLFGIIYPGLSLAAIVVTANHYFLDAVVGAMIMLGSYGIYLLIQSPAVSPYARLVPNLAVAGIKRAYSPLRVARTDLSQSPISTNALQHSDHRTFTSERSAGLDEGH